MEDLSGKLNNLDGDQIGKVIQILGLSPNAVRLAKEKKKI